MSLANCERLSVFTYFEKQEMYDVETLLFKLRDLAIDADRGVSGLEDKLENLLKQLREKYKQGKLSDDTVEEIKSRKARIQDINRQLNSGIMKPKIKPNPNDNWRYCHLCRKRAVKVLYNKYGGKRSHCFNCEFRNSPNPFFDW